MNPSIRVSLPDRKHVQVQRGSEVSEVFWSKVGAEWGFDGGDPSKLIVTPVEVFLSNLRWLPDACHYFHTSIEWEPDAKELVQKSLNEVRSISTIMSGVSALNANEVENRLAGTRFCRPLKPFQQRDLGWLLALPHGANFSVPGAGKTAVTFALYEAERSAGKVERLLVICPMSAFESWQTEADACFSETIPIAQFDGKTLPSDTEVCVINYHRLPSSYDEIASWVQDAPTQVVLDEAHRVKRGWQGAWGSNSLRLSRIATRRDILTGTPAPHSVRDVAALVDFVWPNQAQRILPPAVFDARPPNNIAAQVRSSIAPLFVRTTKSDLNLPEPNLKIVEVPLVGKQREIYQALRNQYAGELALTRNDRSQFARMGRVAMYLLAAATNPALLPIGGRPDPITMQPVFPMADFPNDAALLELVENYSRYELPLKLQTLAELLRANALENQKTLVWTNFVPSLLMLENAFTALNPAIIYGGIPSELRLPNALRTREKELARFRTDPNCKVLIANPAATSEGVSLHKECHNAIYLDRSFNAGHYLQSIDRIHRLGMPDVDTNITFLVTQDTIDVTVNQRVREKAELLGEILNDSAVAAMSLPDDDSTEEYIDSGDDMAALFRHLRGEDVVDQRTGAD